MKKILFLFLYSIIFISAKAQNAGGNIIKGTIVDSISKVPLEYATISLFVEGSKKAINGTITDKQGNFILKNIEDGAFTIVLEFIGYKSFSIHNLQLSKVSSSVDLKKISLVSNDMSMQTVTVVSQSKLVENKIDKLVFNAEKDISSQSGVAADVLKKVPQVTVDVDGNVQLSGSTGVRFLINGKPSTAFGSNIVDVLQSIPANQIKSVEVITNPGAKYDAQGIGGIINIILKNNKAKGYNGSLSLSAGTRVENGSFNFNYRKNNFGINSFISGNKKINVTTPSVSDRITTEADTSIILHQNGDMELERHSYQAGIGFDWIYKKYNAFTGSVSFNNFGSTTNGTTHQSLLIDDGTVHSPVLTLINANNKFHFNNTDINLNYKRTFKKEDQELEIGFTSGLGRDHNTLNNQQRLLPQDSLIYSTNSDNPGKVRETEITIDYSQPIKKDITLGFGGKTIFYNISSLSHVLQYDPMQEIFEPNLSLANDLSYKQKVYAAYSELSFPVGKWFDLKVGTRYERTEINTYYSNAQQQAKVPGYNTWVPSVYFIKHLADKQTIKLSYSKRIERPDYEDLNPFVNTNDPKNLTAGNSTLKPEIGYRYELGYTREIGTKGSVVASLFYRVNEEDIQPYITYYAAYQVGDTIYKNVSVTTRKNIGSERNAGINLFGNLNATSKLTLNSNFSLFRRHTINTVDSGYDYNSYNYRFNINATYQFTKLIVAEFFGNFRSARNEAQGKYPSQTTYSFAIRKQFWNKKGSLALTANNFLNEYIKQETKLSGPDFTTNSLRKIPSRSFGINFTWKFGKLEFKKNKVEVDGNGQGD